MKRSVFLQIPLVASALMASAKNFSKDRANKGIKVEAGSIQDQAHGSRDLMKTHGMEVVGPPLTF
jgi:hypothetical protein